MLGKLLLGKLVTGEVSEWGSSVGEIGCWGNWGWGRCLGEVVTGEVVLVIYPNTYRNLPAGLGLIFFSFGGGGSVPVIPRNPTKNHRFY